MSPELPTLAVLARAAVAGTPVRLAYLSKGGEVRHVTHRTVAVLGLGYRREEGWVCAAWCTLRQARRVFRLDHVVSARPEPGPAPEAAGRFDARAFAAEDLQLPRSAPARRAVLRLSGELAMLAPVLFPGWLLEVASDGALLCHARIRRLDVLAGLVASLGAGADAPQPGQLRTMVQSIRAFEARLQEGGSAQPLVRAEHKPPRDGRG